MISANLIILQTVTLQNMFLKNSIYQILILKGSCSILYGKNDLFSEMFSEISKKGNSNSKSIIISVFHILK